MSARRHVKQVRFALLAGSAALVLVVVLCAAFFEHTPDVACIIPSEGAENPVRSARSLDELLSMPADRLASIDIAEMNLLCAEGLRGADGLDVDKCLNMLDKWAEQVRTETGRHLHRFRMNPVEYRNSEGYFRILVLVTVLQQDLGVKYNVQRMRDIDFTNSKDLFIHGMIDDENGGTCVSMPVIYAAVGRRLGYPIRLVLAKEHVFCRWDGPKERFNIEATNRGLNCFEDEYYKTWPVRMSQADILSGRFLKSLSPAEELACFLASRGHCLLDTKRVKEAQAAYAAAHRFAPQEPSYQAWMHLAQRHSVAQPVKRLDSPEVR